MKDLGDLYDWAREVDAIDNSLIIGELVQGTPRRNGYLGGYKEVQLRVGPECPSGKIYLLNDSYEKSYLIDTRTRWQHFVAWVMRLLKRE